MITKPMSFSEAIRSLLDREQLPAEWSAADWAAQESDFRARAFWSSRIENARFLDRAQGFLFDFMVGTTEQVTGPDGVTRTALRAGGRADFIERMRDFMIAEGMATEAQIERANQGDVTNIVSNARLKLIFDTNVRQAYGFGQWKQGQKPAVLYRFPAARLIRVRSVRVPRQRHQDNMGEVLLKNDPRWATFHNAKEIGGFEVPWGPFGFNSGADMESVKREEAIKLGLDVDSVTPQEGRITDKLEEPESPRMDPALKAKLRAELATMKARLAGRQTPQEAAREAAERVRLRNLARLAG